GERLAGDAPADAPAAVATGPLRALAGKLEPLLREKDGGKALERLLWQARLPYTPAEFLVGSAILAILALGAGWLLLGAQGAAFAVAGLIPAMLAVRRARANRRLLVAQLPDALLLLTNALRSGHGLMQAIRVVPSQAPAPTSTEMAALLEEINWGLPVERALANLATRGGVVELDLAVGAMLVQRETGGNLAEILTNLQETLRDRARIAGEVHALTAQGRLSGWVLSLLPAAIGALFAVINPGYLLPFLADPRGQALAAGAGIAQLLGILAIRRIVSVRY
ncbi:MAG: type II secretion system F family protein, partial [Candidatus Sericytochromatia bacterium]|nr:type II secretion system F family protein [Candidatus Tanganyikabacteria bacterium]